MSTNSCACSASTDKFVYSFGGGSADGNGSMKNLLGGKGANLAEMARIGLPVPPGFTITTEVCTTLTRYWVFCWLLWSMFGQNH